MVVRVPASSANLGSGFDVMAIALDLWAEIGTVSGDDLPTGALVVDAHHPATIAFKRAGGQGALWVRSSIPMGRGLGYSGAVRVGGIVAAHEQRHGPDRQAFERARLTMLALAAELEGHADNVAASLLGGAVVCAGGTARRVPVRVEWELLAWVPSDGTSTDRSRAALPDTVSRDDAVFNLGRVGLLVAALAEGDLDALRTATDDRLHQPLRLSRVSDSAEALRAALAAGAAAAWLSGSGPTVLVACRPGESSTIAPVLPPSGAVRTVVLDAQGAVIGHVAS
jgi:homoserine kinase